MNKITFTLLTSIALLAIGQNAFAAGEQGKSDRRGPPPEAFTACEGKSAGEIAEFQSPRGDVVTGTCEEHKGTMILRPDNPRGNSENGDRPEERPAQ